VFTYHGRMLWDLIVERARAARASGDLESIPTSADIFERHGVKWVIRVAGHLVKKKKEATAPSRNPFLPYDPALFVQDLSETHVCLLNKFNVVEHHLVIVTRHFEHQRTMLTASDFEAARLSLEQIDGLVFYNGGKAAGASQPHKHLQLVPRLDPALEGIPIEPLLGRLPFLHAVRRVDERTDLLDGYRAMMGEIEADPRIGAAREVEAREIAPEGPGERQPFPYDLLLTRRWMLVVPRTQQATDGIEVNSLGYAGAFLAKTEEQRKRIEHDPLAVLAQVGVTSK
jgi:sulfate adenylyltransferase (ADP) / ATP adenylyltransferase